MSSTEGFHTAPPKLLLPVKMVVWDLDDTFWTGTLSEGVVALHESRVAIVRSLNRRGIINSICSKNDAEAVRRMLENHGVWEEFVFPSIDWSAKGQRVAWIVENAQLARRMCSSSTTWNSTDRKSATSYPPFKRLDRRS